MKDFFKKFEEYMMAATFAEAGEHKTALEMLTERKQARSRKRAKVRAGAPRPRPEMRATSADE